ncbi:MAG: Uma2 family endonuclease [Rubrobacter sp.]|nr:Uma2 family endonuclease [Rubrobacter sp.]MDQ3639288.1 Uma2 family endonuclease [Actinomycetota bacterium]
MTEKVMSAAAITRHCFTVEEYHKMGEAGVFPEDDRVELIDGEVVEMSLIGWRHARCVGRLTMALARLAGDRYVVGVQNPLTISEYGEPWPDLALHEEPPPGRLPAPEDVLLVVEVSDTTLACDKDVKLPRYARAGIPEVWIVDLRGELVEVHAGLEDGRYGTVGKYGPEGDLRSGTLAEISLPVRTVLG